MKQFELIDLLNKFRSMPSETEWLEFKEAKNNFDFDDLGKYFSALSNEANLKDVSSAWLIFGIHDKTRNIVGSNYRLERISLDKLKREIANKTTNRITYTEIYELQLAEGRVIMFQIPAAPLGIPIAWEGHYYGREGESLSPLNLQEIETIRSEIKQTDWSAKICEGATIDDLDSNAIVKARIEYKIKYPHLAEEIDNWDDITFLNKAKIAIQGSITNTAIILLGKEESEHFLLPSIAKISWILKDEHNSEKDYEHFGPPFILHTDSLMSKIRNLKYRYLINDFTLFPVEITKYESYVIREALHNCIAHQDYELKGRVNVVEYPDELIFSNLGSFLPKSIENVIECDSPPEYYRNQFLSNAMVNLNMIDTIGSGIKRMFTLQRNRFFPLPDYNLSDPQKVIVRIYGKVIDINYTKLLMKNTDLNIKTVILLDKVQKKMKLTDPEYKILKRERLVAGRYPNIYVSAEIAAVTGDKSVYIKNRAFDNEYYKELILAFIREYGSASRKEIDDLLIDKLSDVLDAKQKRNKVRNLLYDMSKNDKTITNIGSSRMPKWILYISH